jgi:hypothetical protein
VDSSDNLYVTGLTKGGLDGNTNSGGGNVGDNLKDAFLVKYNSSGEKQWTQQWGTALADAGTGMTVDSSDNIYVTGGTKGGLDGNTNSGGWDIFLIKFNSNGEKQWTQQFGDTGSDSGKEVVVDSSDNIYVFGRSDEEDIAKLLLVKFNSSGIKQWTQKWGSSDSITARGMTIDSSDNIYVTRYTEGGLDGNTNSGDNDTFLVKYNSDGVLQ